MFLHTAMQPTYIQSDIYGIHLHTLHLEGWIISQSRGRQVALSENAI